ncbi:MAG: FliI/YscN family ATPase [Chloroflexota bacterium]|jgi:FliI/YscN family ATPase
MKITPVIPDLDRYRKAITRLQTTRLHGKVVQVVGLTIEVVGVDSQIGEVCEIQTKGGDTLLSEVVGFRNERTLLMPLGDMQGIQPGSPVYPTRDVFRTPVGKSLLGRVLDGLGRPLDTKGPLGLLETRQIYAHAPHPLTRKAIDEPLVTRTRAIDGLLTIGKGQRIGIFAGSGVGKSTLLGSLARNARADVNVIGLVGERGREVAEFIDRDLGPEGLERSVVVVATSDQPALVRLKAAWVSTTIAEYFRDLSYDVILMMDSVTRFAMAQREVGLAVGEPPASKGYTPSVFALLPQLLERAGTGDKGSSITGLYTVLVEGDDFNEPISDSVRSILDGHIALSREIAARNHYPAIDVLHSLSRVMPAVTKQDHRKWAGQMRKLMATYEKARDLVNIGAYVSGSDQDIDASLESLPRINAFLQQTPTEATAYEDTLTMLAEIGGKGS